MSFDADLLADRRRLRRRLSWWRAVAFLLVIAALLAAAWAMRDRVGAGERQIARIEISGFISGDERTLDLIKRVRESKAVDAVLVEISSPGGTTSGSEAIYDALRRLSAEKPTVAVVDSMAASGAYITAIATDHIVSRETSLVGSIGVLFQFPNFTNLLDHVGVNVETIKSSPLKAAPSGFEPTSPEARAAIASLVSDSFDWFKRLVRERRSFNDAQLNAVADGRVFTGHQALGLKLVDEIGGERQAIAWLEREKKITRDLPVREWKRRSSDSDWGLWSALGTGATLLGFHDLAAVFDRLDNQLAAQRLDGLLALWHPSLEK
jgi:protease-4